MRFAYVPFVVLAASFSLIAAQTANIEPTPSPIKIDLMQRPTPVYVLNFPEVQTVEGTVTVSNLPAVQAVGGTVNVGNLPLGDDGSVRVSAGPTRPQVMYELLSEPLTITAYGSVQLPTVQTGGYTTVGIYSAGDGATLNPEWRWAADEDFEKVNDYRAGYDGQRGGSANCFTYVGSRVLCSNLGGELRITLQGNGYTSGTVTSVRVYLFP